MICLHPVSIRKPEYRSLTIDRNTPCVSRFYMTVPCGKCFNCMKRKQLTWVMRLSYENLYHNSSIFITLTYNNENLKETNKRDIQLYLKRLRKATGKKIRYYATSEHGEKTQRPHYHAIIFGLSKSLDSEVVRNKWPFGNVYIGTVTPKSITYITKYCYKLVLTEYDDFLLCSRRPMLGHQYISTMASYHMDDPDNRLYVELFGSRYPLHRGFRLAIYPDNYPYPYHQRDGITPEELIYLLDLEKHSLNKLKQHVVQ